MKQIGISIFFCVGILFSDPWAQNPYTSSYQYLTIYEKTVFDEVIKFWHEDTLKGPVHSNDSIAIMENPVFYDTVSTSMDGFWIGPSYSPQFSVRPVFNAPRVMLPDSAHEIRQMAIMNGLFFDSNNGQLASRLVFLDTDGWILYQWQMGTPFDSTAIVATGPAPGGETFFIDGYLELKGIFRGVATVGARGHPDPEEYLGYHSIKLLDDIRYWFADEQTGSFNDTTGGYADMLGIVSESHICIANTRENGREDGIHAEPGNWNRHSIVITAAMVALGESFSFEDQNEPPPNPVIWEFFTGNYSCPNPPAGPFSDERGDIYLKGSLTQRRRGYVHRSNHNGTGYGKCYDFDRRFRTNSPFLGIKARHMPVLSPNELHFGNIAIGQSDTLVTILSNQGGTYVDIEAIYTSDSTFTINVEGISDTTTLIPGDTLDIRVIFEPEEIQLYSDTLIVALYYGGDLRMPLSGTGYIPSGISKIQLLPGDLELSVFPNPFNDQVRISWSLDHKPITLTLFNISGRRVNSQVFPVKLSEQASYVWHPVNLAGGVYIIRLTKQDKVQYEKVVYLK